MGTEHTIRSIVVEEDQYLDREILRELDAAAEKGWEVFQVIIREPGFHVEYERDVRTVKFLARRSHDDEIATDLKRLLVRDIGIHRPPDFPSITPGKKEL